MQIPLRHGAAIFELIVIMELGKLKTGGLYKCFLGSFRSTGDTFLIVSCAADREAIYFF